MPITIFAFIVIILTVVFYFISLSIYSLYLLKRLKANPSYVNGKIYKITEHWSGKGGMYYNIFYKYEVNGNNFNGKLNFGKNAIDPDGLLNSEVKVAYQTEKPSNSCPEIFLNSWPKRCILIAACYILLLIALVPALFKGFLIK